MSRVLLPIHPEYAESILSQRKLFEFRRKGPLQVDTFILYATAPVSLAIGEVDVSDVLRAPPETLWRLTFDRGISEAAFMDYFKGCAQGLAYRLGRPRRYENGRSLASLGLRRPPQSFVYLKNGM